MNLTNLETFVVLARLRHFGHTARELNTTQPTVSSRIAALERELGVRLIDRDGGHFHLTAAGEEALKTCERLLADFDAMKNTLAEPGGVTGTLRIGAIDAIAQTWLPRFYERARESYPHARIGINVNSTIDLHAAMRNGTVDLAFCLDPVLEEGYRSFVICTYAMSWVGSPKLAQRGRVYSVAELGALPLITFPRNSPPYRMITPYFLDESVLASQLSNCNSLPAMIRLAIDGFGIAAVPTIVVRRELQSGELVSMEVRKPFPPMPIVATYHPKAGHLERVAELARQSAQEFCASVDPALAWT